MQTHFLGNPSWLLPSLMRVMLCCGVWFPIRLQPLPARTHLVWYVCIAQLQYNL